MNRAPVSLQCASHQAVPRIALCVQLLVCALIVIGGVAYSRATSGGLIYPLSGFLTASLLWSLGSWWRINGTVFDPYGMFMTSLFLFNAGQAPLEILGLNENGFLGGKFDNEVVTATLYMVLLGVNFTHLGALLVAVRRKHAAPLRWSTADSQSLRAVGWILLGVSIVPSAVLLWDAAKTVVSTGYMSLYQRQVVTGLAAGPQVIAMFTVPAALLLLAGAHGRRREKVTALVLISFHTALQLFIGSRSTGIMPACAFAWLWHQCEWRLKTRWVLMPALVLTLALVPIVRQTRELSGEDRVAVKTFVDSYRSIDNPLVATVSEMGSSMQTVAYTYVLVPNARVFDRGVGYAYAALTVLPNLFWDVHPTISHGLASDWLIATVDPMAATRGGGLGYSCVAEAYLNFGWIGVPVVMMLIGFTIATLATWGNGGDYRRRLALTAAFTAFALRFPRDEAGAMLRFLVWYTYLPYLATSLLAGLGRRNLVAFSKLHKVDQALT